MKEYKNIKDLKLHTKGYGIMVKHTGDFVMLMPTKKYVKEHGEGNYETACIDLSKWFGLIGMILNDGTVRMSVRGDDE